MLGGILLGLAGLFTIVAAVMDWNWFMNHHRARLFVMLFGRQGARVFYAILGLIIAAIGVFLTITGG